MRGAYRSAVTQKLMNDEERREYSELRWRGASEDALDLFEVLLEFGWAMDLFLSERAQ